MKCCATICRKAWRTLCEKVRRILCENWEGVTYLVWEGVVQIVVDLQELGAESHCYVGEDVLEEVVYGDVIGDGAVSEVVHHVRRLNL